MEQDTSKVPSHCFSRSFGAHEPQLHPLSPFYPCVSVETGCRKRTRRLGSNAHDVGSAPNAGGPSKEAAFLCRLCRRGRGQAGRTRFRRKGLSSPGPFSRSRCLEWRPYPGARLGPGCTAGDGPTINRPCYALSFLVYSVTHGVPALQDQPCVRTKSAHELEITVSTKFHELEICL